MRSFDSRRRVYAALSLLLQYPETPVVKALPQVRELAPHLSVDQQRLLLRFTDWLQATPLLQAQAHYVDLFDRKRRACLYLSYYLNGDTRRRGMALVEFKELYRSAGWDATDAELPDFLPTLLQFAAAGDTDAAEEVLAMHRAGLVVLATALREAHSPYAALADLLLDVVPAHQVPEDMALRLIEAGPPTEMVGLEPFAAAETMGVGAR